MKNINSKINKNQGKTAFTRYRAFAFVPMTVFELKRTGQS